MVKLLSAAALLAATSSVAAADWNIINWGAGCARRGCYYSFNVTGPADGVIPSFSAYCTGDEEHTKENFFKPCGVNDAGLGNRGVSAKFVPRPDPNSNIKQIAVSFEYLNLTTKVARNFTGTADIRFNAFVAPPQNYTIKNVKEN